jgi:hypothetical protein
METTYHQEKNYYVHLNEFELWPEIEQFLLSSSDTENFFCGFPRWSNICEILLISHGYAGIPIQPDNYYYTNEKSSSG